MNYTKGEWKVEYETQVVCGDRLIANTGGYATTANYKLIQEENVANARLIAAAPGLYEGLKEASAVINSLLIKYELSGSRESLQRTLNDLNEALSKVEGE